MAAFSAKDVQRLRQSSGAGMMDAKKALTENDGDFDAAANWLREKGLAQSAKRADRENAEGVVASAQLDGVAALVELKCETDFVAKSERFKDLADEMALLVVAKGADAVNEKTPVLEELKVTLKENIELGRVVRYEAASGNVLDNYIHIQNQRGVNGVLIELDGGDADLADEVCLHIAFARPPFLTRDEVPAAEVEAERATLETLSRNEGKPDAAIPKIVEGRLTGWFRERVLLEQKYVKDEKKTITDLLGGVQVVRFEQVEIGQA